MDPASALTSLDSLCSPSPLDMVDQFSFLDVCLEDDSLLPLGKEEALSSHSQDRDSPSGTYVFIFAGHRLRSLIMKLDAVGCDFPAG